MKFVIVCLTISVVTSCVSMSQEPSTTAVDAGNAILQRFVGKWTTKSTPVTADSIAPTAYMGTMEAHMLGNTWLINEYDAVMSGMQFNAIQRLGYDADKKTYFGTWADSFMTYEWKLEGEIDGNRLIVNSKGSDPSKPGKQAHFRDEYEFKSPDLILTTSSIQTADGKWSPFMTGQFRRSAATNKPEQRTEVMPFLMFEGQAEEAMTFYTSLFPDAKIESVQKYGPDEAEKEGSIKMAKFTVAGQRVMCIDSPPIHDITFTPSFSFFVECESEDQLDKLFAKLSKDGKVMMPLDNYGFSQKFGWTSDRFGVSWQLNLAADVAISK